MTFERTHDGRHGEACGPCRWGTVQIAAAATPSRRPQAVFHSEREKRWAKDHQAVRTLKKQGITPASIDGAADLANRATSRAQIESGSLTMGEAT